MSLKDFLFLLWGLIPCVLFVLVGAILAWKFKSYNEKAENATNDLKKLEELKDLLNRCIAFFAAFVIGGALFKILHLPGCDQALAIGLGAEAGIFIAVSLTVNTFELLDKQNGASETSEDEGKPKTGNTSEDNPTDALKESIKSLTESLNTINQSLSSSDGKNIGTNLAELNTKVKEAREKLDNTFK